VPFSPGSATDILARAVSVRLTEIWNQQVLIDNRPGAGGIVAGEMLLKAVPDAHTQLMVSSGHAVNPSLYPKLPYDTVRDFAGVAGVAVIPNVMVGSPSLGLKSARDLLDLAKKRPNGLLFASAGIGSATHLNGEQVRSLAKIQATHVPFKGTPEAIADTLGARVDFFMAPLVGAIAQIRGGRLQALAVSSSRRSPALPDVPPLVETLPGAVYETWFGLLAPRQTPRELLRRVNADVNRVLGLPEVRDQFLALGAETMPMTPDQFDKFIVAQVELLGAIVRESGAKPE